MPPSSSSDDAPADKRTNSRLHSRLPAGDAQGEAQLPPHRVTASLRAQMERSWRDIQRALARRVKLARQALRRSPDCADAYVILGQEASDLRKAIRWFEEGVRAGERALEPEAFREN